MTPRLTRGLLGVLGFLATVGPFATDMYLASFPEIAADLGAQPAAVQLTLTAFLIGIGAGQLVLGPLSDRYGRRPVLLWSLAVFALASIAMVFVPGIEAFVVLRVVQGLSGAAGAVLARAIAVDLSSGKDAVRALSLIAMLVGLGPLIAPPIGGAISVVWGWRGVLATLAAIAVAMAVLAAGLGPGSPPPARRHPGGLGRTVREFGVIVTDRGTIGFVLAFGFGFVSLMAYISASPFVGQIVLGMDPVVYALSFAAGASAMIGANLVNARVAVRTGPRRMLGAGLLLSLAGSTAMLLLVLLTALTAPTFIACAFVATAGASLAMSNASALAFGRAETARGSVAALLGACQFLLGSLATPVVGLWGEETALPMAAVMLVAAATAALAGASTHRPAGR